MADNKEKLKILNKELNELKSKFEENREDVDDSFNEVFQTKKMKPLLAIPKARRLLKGHFGKIYSLSWAEKFDGKEVDRILASVSQDGKLIVWEAFNNEKLHTIYLPSSWIMACSIEKEEGKIIACGGLDNIITLYALSSRSESRVQKELSGHDAYISCVNFMSSSNFVTSSGDNSCKYWDIESAIATSTFSEHLSDVMSVSCNPEDINLFISGSCDAYIKMWDIRQPKSAGTFSGHESEINSVQYLPNGLAFCSGSDDTTCKLFDVRSYKVINSYSNDHITIGASSVDVSHSGRLIFAGYDDKSCKVWDVTNGKVPVWVLQGHETRVSCVGVNKTGTAVATGSWDTTLRIWA